MICIGIVNGKRIIMFVCVLIKLLHTAAVVGRVVLGGRDGLSVGLAVGMLG